MKFALCSGTTTTTTTAAMLAMAVVLASVPFPLVESAPVNAVAGLSQWQNEILDNILTRYGMSDVSQLQGLDENARNGVLSEAAAGGLDSAAIDTVKSSAGVSSDDGSSGNTKGDDKSKFGDDIDGNPTNNDNDSNESEESNYLNSGLSKAGFIGLAVGAGIGAILVFLMLLWCITKKCFPGSKHPRNRDNNENYGRQTFSEYQETVSTSNHGTPRMSGIDGSAMVTPVAIPVRSASNSSKSSTESNVGTGQGDTTPPVQPRLLSANRKDESAAQVANKRYSTFASPLRFFGQDIMVGNDASSRGSVAESTTSSGASTTLVASRAEASSNRTTTMTGMSDFTMARDSVMFNGADKMPKSTAGPKPPSPVGSVRKYSPIAPPSPIVAAAAAAPPPSKARKQSRVTFPPESEEAVQISLTPKNLK